ncbi:MAG: MATE family efflux transporter, partial [Alkalibacterium sp.]|nr:MATE family efflux transporter [Alkalibacterium sp.]
MGQSGNTNNERRDSVECGSASKGNPLNCSRHESSSNDGFSDGEEGTRRPGVNETSPLLSLSRKSYENDRNSFAQGCFERERSLFKNKIKSPNGNENDDTTMQDDIVSKNSDTSVLVELKSLLLSSVPLAITFLLQCSLSSVSVFAAGNLGAVELAAVSVGSLTTSMTGYAIVQGIIAALDTLCPQAFGAKKYYLVGSYVQKCVAMNFAIMLPILFIWIFFGYEIVLIFLPDDESAKYAAMYLQYIAPGIPAYILFECGRKFLQAQGIYHVSTVVLLFAAPSNVVMNLLFVKTFGFIGIPLAISVNYWLMTFGLIACIKYFVRPYSTPSGMHPLTCWNGLHINQAFNDWSELISLAGPGLVMLEAKFFALEVLTLIASRLGTITLASQTIGTAIASLMYQVLIAIGLASSNRIANFLGAGLKSAAKKTTQVSLGLGIIFSSINVCFLYGFRGFIVPLFTKDEKVIKTVEGVMWLIALMQAFDSMNAGSAGCLRGQGQIRIGSIITLLSYYLVGIPLTIFLTLYSTM